MVDLLGLISTYLAGNNDKFTARLYFFFNHNLALCFQGTYKVVAVNIYEPVVTLLALDKVKILRGIKIRRWIGAVYDRATLFLFLYQLL